MPGGSQRSARPISPKLPLATCANTPESVTAGSDGSPHRKRITPQLILDAIDDVSRLLERNLETRFAWVPRDDCGLWVGAKSKMPPLPGLVQVTSAETYSTGAPHRCSRDMRSSEHATSAKKSGLRDEGWYRIPDSNR